MYNIEIPGQSIHQITSGMVIDIMRFIIGAQFNLGQSLNNTCLELEA